MCDLYRKIAVCSQGKIGLITGMKELPWGLSYVGIALDGTEWASRHPTVIAETLEDYLKGASLGAEKEVC
jgi:hypothetical protein